MIRGFHDENCNKFWLPIEDEYSLYRTYMFNVVKECEDIYIEVRSYLDGEFRIIIDAKKIIPKLSVPLKDTEREKLKNIK